MAIVVQRSYYLFAFYQIFMYIEVIQRGKKA